MARGLNSKKLANLAQAAVMTAGTPEELPGYTYPIGWQVPKTLGAAADKLYATQQRRLELQRQAEALKVEETAYRNYIITVLPSQDSNGVAGKVCRVSVKSKDVPRVESWPDVYAFIVAEYTKQAKKKSGLQDGAFALLQRSLGSAFVKETWECGKAVPGVGKFTVHELSINKL